QVDGALALVFGADRQLQGDGVLAELLADLVHHRLEVRADAVHLVDEGDAGHAVLVGLAPHGLGLRLHAADGAEDADGAVEDAQRALHLDGEVDVAGRVDDVDAVVAPERGGGGRRDGDAALLLLDHPVRGRGPLVHLTDLVGDAGVIEDALRRRGFTRVDVGHDPDVSRLFQRYLACHVLFSSRTTDSRRGRARRQLERSIFVFPVARSGTAEPVLCYPVETELRKADETALTANCYHR